jgi:integration host factor subunit alpha
MVETFFDEIRNALERGEAVKLSGFGNFQLRDKPQRPGRNPKTGEEIPITARRVVTFHASQKLKSMVEEANPASSLAGCVTQPDSMNDRPNKMELTVLAADPGQTLFHDR